MLSRQTHYGLLACLVALLALGSQPFCAGNLTAELPGTTEETPTEESPDEEEASETEADAISPQRRRELINLQATGVACFVAATQSSSRPRPASSLAPRLSREQTARNGIGGPLRL